MTANRFTVCMLINQTLPVSQLISYARALNLSEALLIVSSHELFDFEKLSLQEALPNCEVLSFLDILDHQSQEWADTQTAKTLRDLHKDVSFRDNYTQHQMTLSCRLKNDILHKTLCKDWLIETGDVVFYHCSGLGIHDVFWRSLGSNAIKTPPLQTPSAPAETTQFHYVGNSDTIGWLFLSSVKRVRFANEVPVRSFDMPTTFDTKCDATLMEDIHSGVTRNVGKDLHWRTATTIHGYRPWMIRKIPNLDICIDGFHPPNYPRSYIDAYPRSANIVTNDPVSAQWFQTHGFKVCSSARLTIPTMNYPEEINDLNTVVFALNHAGDWSALINRGDTDRLVVSAYKLAKACPEQTIIIRPHPTMAHCAHEGAGSLDRLKEFVRRTDCSNLFLSQEPLEYDFARGDLFISEYSQVLIDAWRTGKPGIIANLTGRVSFMEAFTGMGFATIKNLPALIGTVQRMLIQPKRTKQKLISAQQRYNTKLQEFLK